MPYETNTVTEEDRSRAYAAIWVGFAATPVAIAARLLEFDNLFTAIAFGFAIGGLLLSVLGRGQDGYFVELCAAGHRWMAAFLALYLFGTFIVELMDVSYTIGSSLTYDGEAERHLRGTFAYLIDGPLIVLASLLAFYGGYAFARLRG